MASAEAKLFACALADGVLASDKGATVPRVLRWAQRQFSETEYNTPNEVCVRTRSG